MSKGYDCESRTSAMDIDSEDHDEVNRLATFTTTDAPSSPLRDMEVEQVSSHQLPSPMNTTTHQSGSNAGVLRLTAQSLSAETFLEAGDPEHSSIYEVKSHKVMKAGREWDIPNGYHLIHDNKLRTLSTKADAYDQTKKVMTTRQSVVN